LGEYFSEYALNKYRVRVEVEYFLALGAILPTLKGVNLKPDACRKIYEDFSVEDAVKVKNTEKITNHDVKAIEYYVKEKLEEIGLKEYQEFVHFGLTSEDVNCTANPLALKEFVQHVYIPALENDIIKPLKELAKSTYDVPMLARTHGQPATPTMLGKEIYVFVDRLEKQLELLKQIPYSGKFGGATGGMNAQCIAYGDIDWITFANGFYKKSFDLNRQQFTTQIEHYDDTGAVFDTCKRINVILLDFSKDMWQYISMEYFKQKVIKNEVGRSAMPHKVNPIDFENAEGNFGVANCVFEHLAVKLPVSRLQRDLTDSTVRRNYGVPFGHTMVGFASLKRGVGKLLLNEKKIDEDLEKNWAVVAEAIQTVLRREQYEKPYEALKAFTRGAEINKDLMMRFVDSLDVKPDVRKELEAITPQSFARAGQIPSI
jgi:adenylosuccinate lyase